MNKLFGIEIATLAGVLSAMLILVIASLALLALRRPVFLKLGLRPIPRRRSQSALIVVGLMLATLIITAAFVTGDTLSGSIREVAIEGLGEIDEVIQVSGSSQDLPYFKMAKYEYLNTQLAEYTLVDRLLPAIGENAPVINPRSRRSLGNIGVMGLNPEDVWVMPEGELRDAEGRLLAIEELNMNEVYLNAAAAKELEAVVGDTLEIYTSSRPKDYIVRGIAGEGESSRILVSLRNAQHMFNQHDRINQIVVSNAGDALGGVEHSQVVTTHLRGLLTDPKAARELYAFLARDPTVAPALREAAEKLEGNTRTDLLALADGLERGELTPETRSLLADEDLADRVQSILIDAGWGTKPLRDRLSRLFGDLSELTVSDYKRDTLDSSDLAGSVFTTIFVASGLFGIAAGLVLIFLIFVMLAAERKSEMGMVRAVGGQRGHLVEMFTYEGTAYDLAAAGVGMALGVGTGLVSALTLGQAFAGVGLSITPHISVPSLVVSYSLGMLVTFATVLFSANKVSHLNIVSAIRDLPEPPRPSTFLRDRLLAPFRAVVDGFRALFRLKILRALRAWLLGVPGSILRLVWLGFSSGPFTLLLGLLLTPIGIQRANAAAYGTGVSFVIIGGALMLRGLLAPLVRRAGRGRRWNAENLLDRVTYTLMGLTLTALWALPSRVLEEKLGLPELGGGAEMLFVSGILLVSGAVLVIMFNTDLILRLVLLVLGRSPRFAPVLRMAVAYPLSSRFRTGMTIAIFAVVIFSVIFMATLFKVNEIVLSDTEQFTGGFDLRVSSSSNNPVDDLPRAIDLHRGLRQEDYAVVAALTTLSVEAKQKGAERWAGYPLLAGDAVYLSNVDYDVGVKAEGFNTAAEIWATVREHPGFAVVDRLAVPSRTTTAYVVGGPTFKLEGVYLEDETMKPIQVEVRDPNSEASTEITIIGVLEQSALTGYGLYTSQETLAEGLNIELPAPTYYISLAQGVDPGASEAALESAFLKNGVESTNLIQEMQDAMAQQLVFQQLMLSFLTVGLVVGVAALGVISSRAVVERRQQIGMLRALGFQREMVSWIFLIESSFVALLGIVLGIGLALIPASQMVNDMAVDIPGIEFQVPWTEIVVVFVLAYGMALLATWLPALQAARVLPAEALRYE